MPRSTRNAISLDDARRAYSLRSDGLGWAHINQRLGRTPQRTTSLRQAVVAYAETYGLDTGCLRLGPVRVPRPTGLTFGVEIECNGLSPIRAQHALRAAGIDAHAESYNHRTRPHWKIVTDATVSGCEVVSPPLPFVDESFATIRTIVQAMRDAGATVRSNCGLHVHVGVRGMTRQQVVDFARAYVERQDIFSAFVSRSRRQGMYCSSYRAGEFDAAATRFLADPRTGHLPRYRTVNLLAFAKHGTLEFRQHQGTLNAAKIEHWVRTIFALRHAVVEGQTPSLADGEQFLADLRQNAGLPAASVRHMSRRLASVR